MTTMEIVIPPGVQPGQMLAIPTSAGQVQIQVPPGAQPGQKLQFTVNLPASAPAPAYQRPAPAPPQPAYQRPAPPPQPQRNQDFFASQPSGGGSFLGLGDDFLSSPFQQMMGSTSRKASGFEESPTQVVPCSNCLVSLAPDQIGTWECCGTYKGVLRSGLSCLFLDCCGACVTTHALSTRILENRIRSETKTKDDVFVTVDVAVQMQVQADNAFGAVYRLDDPLVQVDSYVRDVIRGVFPKMRIDEAFEAKDSVAQAVKERLTEVMNSFGYSIMNVLVTDLVPDREVINAMNKIETEKRLQVASETKALAEKTVTIREAEAKAETSALHGQGAARQRGAIVEGLRSALGEVRSENMRELMLVTNYFDTMKYLSKGQASTIFVSNTESMASSEELLRNGFMQGMAADIKRQT